MKVNLADTCATLKFRPFKDALISIIRVLKVAFILKKKLLVVGAGWAGQTIAGEVSKSKDYEVSGFLDDKISEPAVTIQNGRGPMDIPIVGRSKKLYQTVRKNNADGVILATPESVDDTLLDEVVTCFEKGVPIYQMQELYSTLTKKIPLDHIDHNWMIPRLKPYKRNISNMINGLLDYTTSLFLLVFVYFPLFPFIALAIKLDSSGPVYFYQKRVGLHGKRFTLLKFRSMTHNARSEGASWTTENDVRITRVGKFLRKYRIDELPQLINVFRGEMALIGPRPEAIDLVSTFRREIPFYEYRYIVKPGITGWAQVNHTNTCSIDGAIEKLKYDLYWVKNRSTFLNLRIIFKTIKVALTGFGSV